jgi:hypothetical protein
MNTKIKFLEIMLSDLVSHRDTLELELNRVLNDDNSIITHKKIDFDKILGEITETNNKISLLSDFMSNLIQNNNNNKD